MDVRSRAALAKITRFDQLIAYLRDELDWPIGRESFVNDDDLFFDFTAAELGFDAKTAAKIEEIRRLRPLSAKQPWGIFFVRFEPKRLPVVALRRILSQVAIKKRASSNNSERAAWAPDDLLFISSYGEGNHRQISFAHFSDEAGTHDLPTLKVLGWENRDTALHLDAVAAALSKHLRWPTDEEDAASWREQWRSAFSVRHREVISTSKDLSIRLAQIARAIRDRIKSALEIEIETGPLTSLFKEFQAALVHDLDGDGFADMYAQTIAYGLLSARITDPTAKADDFAVHMRTSPLLRELMEAFLKVGHRRKDRLSVGIDFDELGIADIIDVLDQANMEAVIRDFGDRNPAEDPVIHFYELFLREYDAKRRMQRGVFYTPRPIVSYIVRSADRILQNDFGLADGLADTSTWGEVAARLKFPLPSGVEPHEAFVQILDPATGTGTFLVEVIDVIHQRLSAKWTSQGVAPEQQLRLWNDYVSAHLLTRLYGFELLMAPYAIANLKISLKLLETGYRFETDDRACIYLTNSLEPANEAKNEQMQFSQWAPALAHEARAVSEVKRGRRFTVVIGNPPYSAVSSNLTPELRRIVRPYRFVNGEKIKERSMLQFEKNIQDDYVKFIAFSQARISESSVGVCALITNHSYLDGPTLRGMRWSIESNFDSCWFLDLHGNANKAEQPPDGSADENVFDIRQGVAICTLLKLPAHSSNRAFVCDLWGAREAKYAALSGNTIEETPWEAIEPNAPYYYFIRADTEPFAQEWSEWPAVSELFIKRSTGTETGFDDLLVNFSAAALRTRIATFASDPKATLLKEFAFEEGHAASLFSRRKEMRVLERGDVRQFQLRAYDYRWALLRKDLLKTNSFNVMLDLGKGAPGLATTRQTKEHFSALAVQGFCGHKLNSSYDRSYVFPLFATAQDGLIKAAQSCLDSDLVRLFRSVGAERTASLSDRELASMIFCYTLGVLNAPSYSRMFEQRLRRDWARVPLPATADVFCDVADLGKELMEFQLLSSPEIEEFATDYFGPSSPIVGRVSWSDDTVWLDSSSGKNGVPVPAGGGFRGVPQATWEYHVGGYQVCQKWLKDRVSRTLTGADMIHYQKIVVAVSATLRLSAAVDDAIANLGGWQSAFRPANGGR